MTCKGLRLVCTLMREIIDAARAVNYQIGYERIDRYLEHWRKNLRERKTSTQQDLERGKLLEYEALGGAVVRTARRHHLQLPAMDAVYALLRPLDGARAAWLHGLAAIALCLAV